MKIFPFAKSMESHGWINRLTGINLLLPQALQLDSLNTIEGITDTAKKYYDWSGGKAFFKLDAMAIIRLSVLNSLALKFLEVKKNER